MLTVMIPLLHLGMFIVGVPYSLEGMIDTQARGGTPYGASMIPTNSKDQALQITLLLGGLYLPGILPKWNSATSATSLPLRNCKI